MKRVTSLFMLVLLFACGEPDEISEVCNEHFDLGQHRLSLELLDYFPADYLNTLNDIVLFNEAGDTLVLEYGGKRSDLNIQSSEKPCGNNGVNTYNVGLENFNLSFTNDEYFLNIGGDLRLNIDFTGTIEMNEPFILAPMDYDTCYNESFSCRFSKKDVNSFNSIFKNTQISNCTTNNTPTVSDPLDVFTSLELNGEVFSDVLVNVNSSNPNFIRIYYNKTYGFLGFEENDEVWIIKP